jgi:hypothetical protein
MRFLQQRGGKLKGAGLELFSRIAFAFRRDLFFVVPKPWGESSGVLRYVGDDLRRYCNLCRNLRAVCDNLGFPADIRASLFDRLLHDAKPPAALLEAVHKAIGPSLARYSALEPDDGYEPQGGDDDPATLPTELAASAIRARRGRRVLRDRLCRLYGNRCALTGACVRDLLEVAYIVPFPSGEVHELNNTILLRADLHTLWDLNLIGVDPQSMRVFLAPRLAGTTYEQLAGRALLARRDGTNVSRDVLEERWRLFVNGHEKVLGKDGESASMASAAKAESARSAPEIEVKPLAAAPERSEAKG